ncbi:hypothetical protein OPT61_g3041 [Boeremia exigua]|uniref:Uncharacterized protein n=1 Tax=Boeremia exigua TaxID=749465 RepID=A0ACC2IJJ7_9PLEO|nr:hypothetical protein OPT61_g3041 [Boeremia exigua]
MYHSIDTDWRIYEPNHKPTSEQVGTQVFAQPEFYSPTLTELINFWYGSINTVVAVTPVQVRATGISVTVDLLLSPPASKYNHADNTYTLDLEWAMSVVGKTEFKDSSFGRKVLRMESPFGQEIVSGSRLPPSISGWLIGVHSKAVYRFPAALFNSNYP